MPELPEVETIRRELAPLLKGRQIRQVLVRRRDIVGWPSAREFRSKVLGCRIVGLERKGKYLVLQLKPRTGSGVGRQQRLIIHLRLSGHLKIMDARTAPARFERIRFLLSSGKALIFVEPRVLGRVYLVTDNNLPPVLKGLENLGLEPIQPRFDAGYLQERCARRRAAIKGLLLDQRIAAGVGNIYSDEALFLAGVRPERRGCDISSAEYEKLAGALRKVLCAGIRHMGTTMTDARYQRPGGMPGGFQRFLKVFDREGEPCRICGAQIQQCRIGNRRSRYCPVCQQ